MAKTPDDPFAIRRAGDPFTSETTATKVKPGKKKSGGLTPIDTSGIVGKKKAVPPTKTAFDAILAKNPAWVQYKQGIIAAAKQWDVDENQLLTLLIRNNPKADPKNLADISDYQTPKSYNPKRFVEFQHLIESKTGFNPKNPLFAISYTAWRMNGQLGGYNEDIDAYWKAAYGGTGVGPTSVYTSAGVGRYQAKPTVTVEGKGDRSQSFKVYAKSLSDPYVMGVDKNGKVITNSDPGGQKPVMYDGQPLTVSGLGQVRRYLEPYFISYTGGRPSDGQILQNMNLSTYTITDQLSMNTKTFEKSPIYKKMALQYQGVARDLMPKGAKLPTNLLREAIVNEWSEGALQEKLRQTGLYNKSPEYLNNNAVLDSSYRNIMGVPDAGASAVIDKATRLGWTQGVFESWLRSTPQYKYSPEYQAKAVNFLGAMGLFTGSRPTLDEVTAKQLAKVGETSLMGTGSIAPPIDLMPSGKNPILKSTYPGYQASQKPTPKPAKAATPAKPKAKTPTGKSPVTKPATTPGKKPLY